MCWWCDGVAEWSPVTLGTVAPGSMLGNHRHKRMGSAWSVIEWLVGWVQLCSCCALASYPYITQNLLLLCPRPLILILIPNPLIFCIELQWLVAVLVKSFKVLRGRVDIYSEKIRCTFVQFTFHLEKWSHTTSMLLHVNLYEVSWMLIILTWTWRQMRDVMRLYSRMRLYGANLLCSPGNSKYNFLLF